MEQPFDPYQQWLGIPPQGQPPDHYQLLGIAPFEPDPNVIAQAAKTRMARVNTLGGKEHGELSRRLLREIAKARNCLLSSSQRAEYDRTLRGRPAAEGTTPAATIVSAAGQTGAGPRINGPAENVAPRSGSSRALPRLLGREGRRWQVVVLITAVIVLLLVVVSAVVLMGRGGSATAEKPESVGPAVRPASVDEADAAPPDEPGPKAESDARPEGPVNHEDDKLDQAAAGGEAVPSLLDLDRALGDLAPRASDSREPADDRADDSESEEPAPAAAGSEPEATQHSVSARPSKLAVPDSARQQAAELRIRRVLGKELDAANTPDDHSALATKLLQLGRDTAGDPATRFVLFRLAYQRAGRAGELSKALGIIDTIGQHYDVDVLEMKAEVLTELVDSLQAAPDTLELLRESIDTAKRLADESVAGDSYRAGSRFCRAAILAARKINDVQAVRQWTAREREIDRLQRRFAEVKAAIDRVSKDPTDGEASLTAGQWYCFEKGDWKKGLPLLAASSDPVLADLARRDMDPAVDFPGQVKLAEDWLTLAQREPGSRQAALKLRAAHWCQRAMTGLDRAIAADDYGSAGRLVRLAMAAAREEGDRERAGELAALKQEIERLGQAFVPIKEAIGVLAGNPSDADANLAVGGWYCFEKGDWERGLPLLARGSDAVLAALARQELAAPDTPEGQLKLADQWWESAEKAKGTAKGSMQARAVDWYQKLLPELAGLDKLRIEKRLEEIEARSTVSSPGRRGRVRGGVVQKGNVALATNGTTASGDFNKPPIDLLDGNTTEYDGVHGYAYGKWPCQWTITFAKVYRLQEIRFLLWDGDNRYSRYAIETSNDGRTFTPLVDRSQGEWRSWQVIRFPPRPVKTIRLTGLFNSEQPNFFVVEFEAYCVPPVLPPD